MDTDGRSVDEIADTVPGPWGRPREPVNVGDRIARPLTPAPRPLIPPPFPSPEEPGTAEEHGLAVRVWGEPARRAALERGRPVVDHPFLDSFSLALDGKLEHFAALLRALPSGLTEWAVHPGLVSEEARAADPDGWRVRATDHAFLTSPAARDIVREEGVTLIDYRDIQRGWAS